MARALEAEPLYLPVVGRDQKPPANSLFQKRLAMHWAVVLHIFPGLACC